MADECTTWTTNLPSPGRVSVSIKQLRSSLAYAFSSIDVDYPTECDDEYWDTEIDDPDQAFKQPKGKPSMITAMIQQLKLYEIASFMQRTLYSTKKWRWITGRRGEEWERRVVAQLDSALNKWKDDLPQHRESRFPAPVLVL